ncbi:MAG: nicotinate phosphoribosyltransferase [Acidobacteriota bacterium]|nr:nicotinate phosphoribosyltransferase [Acidobacteriota bacterium]
MNLSSFSLGPDDLAFATDLYQLTMAAAYHGRPEAPRACFELFVRRLPEHRNFLVFAGLEQAVAALREMRFTGEHIDYLRSLDSFGGIPDSFFQYLRDFRFRADLDAAAEGTVFFPTEPMLRVTGSLVEAQLVETLLLSILNFQTAVASKAARMVMAAEKPAEAPVAKLAEFGSRRAHGPQAAAWVARAAYLAGFGATSNVLAGQRMGIPVMGTMAHSFVQSFQREEDAFRHYQSLFPGQTIYLVDTYDTVEGVRKAVELGLPFSGVRLDSGDLGELARRSREVLDQGGWADAQIFGSGDLDEYRIETLRREGAPFDAFGIGTQLASIADAPHLGGVYKLVAVEKDGRWRPRLKKSSGKATYPGRKQVFRTEEDGTFTRDRIVPLDSMEGEPGAGPGSQPPPQGEEALLRPILRGGELVPESSEAWSLEAGRGRCREQLRRLPERLRALRVAEEPYAVGIHPQIEELQRSGGPVE